MSPRPEPAPPAAPAPQRELAPWRAAYVRFCSKPVVLAIAASILVAVPLLGGSDDPPPSGPAPAALLTTSGIESQIRVGLAVQLGSRDTAVEGVTCTRDAPSRATCEAEMSGEGAGRYEIEAHIEPGVGLVEWHVAGRLPSQR